MAAKKTKTIKQHYVGAMLDMARGRLPEIDAILDVFGNYGDIESITLEVVAREWDNYQNELEWGESCANDS